MDFMAVPLESIVALRNGIMVLMAIARDGRRLAIFLVNLFFSGDLIRDPNLSALGVSQRRVRALVLLEYIPPP